MRILMCQLKVDSNYYYVQNQENGSDLLSKIKSQLGDDAKNFTISANAGVITVKLNNSDMSASDKTALLTNSVTSLKKLFPESAINSDDDTITVTKNEESTLSGIDLDELYTDKVQVSSKPKSGDDLETTQDQNIMQLIAELLQKLLAYLNLNKSQDTTAETAIVDNSTTENSSLAVTGSEEVVG